MPNNATAQDELIDALQQVTDLDALHVLLSNETVDRFSSPQFSAWLVELVNAERSRRNAPTNGVTDYPLHDFASWPPVHLYQATALTLSVVEAAVMAGRPTTLQFALRLHQVLVGSLGLAFLERAAAWQSLFPI